MGVLDRLSREKDALCRRKEATRAALEEIDAELAEIETAIRVVQRVGADTGPEERDSGWSGQLKHASEAITLRGIISRILEDASPQGLTVHDVVHRASQITGQSVSQNTVSVTLGRIKNDGYAGLNGRHWFHIRKQDAEAAGSPSRETPAAPQLEYKEATDGPPNVM